MGSHSEVRLKRVTVVMPPELHKRLKLNSIEMDITMNEQIIEAVEKYLQCNLNAKSRIDE